jgi:hypothetical protein
MLRLSNTPAPEGRVIRAESWFSIDGTHEAAIDQSYSNKVAGSKQGSEGPEPAKRSNGMGTAVDSLITCAE